VLIEAARGAKSLEACASWNEKRRRTAHVFMRRGSGQNRADVLAFQRQRARLVHAEEMKLHREIKDLNDRIRTEGSTPGLQRALQQAQRYLLRLEKARAQLLQSPKASSDHSIDDLLRRGRSFGSPTASSAASTSSPKRRRRSLDGDDVMAPFLLDQSQEALARLSQPRRLSFTDPSHIDKLPFSRFYGLVVSDEQTAARVSKAATQDRLDAAQAEKARALLHSAGGGGLVPAEKRASRGVPVRRAPRVRVVQEPVLPSQPSFLPLQVGKPATLQQSPKRRKHRRRRRKKTGQQSSRRGHQRKLSITGISGTVREVDASWGKP